MEFALAGDAAMMMSQWTDDIVLLPPAGPIQRGRSVIAEVQLLSRHTHNEVVRLREFDE